MAKATPLKLDPKPVVEVTHEKLEQPIEVSVSPEGEVAVKAVSTETPEEKIGTNSTIKHIPQGESENANDPRYQGRPAKLVTKTASGATCYDW